MKNIQKVRLEFNSDFLKIPNNIWYFGKSLIEVMLSPNGMNVKHINDNCGLIVDN